MRERIMGVRLEDDKLNREEFLNNLFDIFEHFGDQEGSGLTIAINGKYGTGKTTLLDFIKERNVIENNKFNIISYDAWESNFFDKPLVPIMYSISKIEGVGGKVRNAAKKVVKAIPKMLLKTVANISGVDASEMLEGSDVFKEYDEFKKSIYECRKVLTNVCQEKKTIMLVDELDRCLPVYQIQVLESLYHFLNVPNLIIVIAIDKEQLEEAVKNEFGSSTDVFGYLSKFVQYDIDLPNDSIGDYAARLINFKSEYESDVKKIISDMINSLNISVRDMKPLMQQINVTCKEQKDGFGHVKNYYFWYPIKVAFMILLRKFNSNVYKKYFKVEIEDVFGGENIPLRETRYFKFYNDIKTKRFNNVIEVLRNSTLGQVALLHIIGLFDNLDRIERVGLADCINRDEKNTEFLLKESSFFRWSFPTSVNDLVQKIDILM